jgi:hypothetical protein
MSYLILISSFQTVQGEIFGRHLDCLVHLVTENYSALDLLLQGLELSVGSDTDSVPLLGVGVVGR